MAAGQGFKNFSTGDVLTASDVNGYLMQGIWVFANAAARDAAVTSPQEGNSCYLKDTDVIQVYSGSSWVTKSGGSPLTTKGDLYTYSTTDTRLAVGTTNGHVLQVDSTAATGMKWAAAPASDSVTLLSTTTLSGATSTTISPISTAYTHLIILIDDWAAGASADCRINLFGGSVIAFAQRKVLAATYSATGGGGNAYFVVADGAAASSDDFQCTILVPFYSNSAVSRKTAQYWTGYSDNANGQGMQEGVAAIRNSGIGAVTSLTISTSTATNMTGTVRIYGWK